MSRRLLLALLFGVASWCRLARRGAAQETTGDRQELQVANLKDQLEKGLQARLPREFRFIGTIVRMVERNELPLRLVRAAFQWARRQVRAGKYPFPYFERAIRILASRDGIAIP